VADRQYFGIHGPWCWGKLSGHTLHCKPPWADGPEALLLVLPYVPHRCAAWDLIKALEQEAAFYSDVLQGLEPGPPAEQWTSRTEGYQRLQQQVAQQEQSVQPDKLQQALSARLQPCQVRVGRVCLKHATQTFGSLHAQLGCVQVVCDNLRG
jgi:hypothetical protein